MSNETAKTENIVAPALGRALSAIAQRRAMPAAVKSIQSSGATKFEPTATAKCANTCASAM